MKEFDLDKIGRKMPYSAPSEEFFEQLHSKVHSEINRRDRANRAIRTRIVMAVAAAASLLVAVFVHNKIDYRVDMSGTEYIMSENSIDASIDSYFKNLSDEELAYLSDGAAALDEFFITLQNE